MSYHSRALQCCLLKYNSRSKMRTNPEGSLALDDDGVRLQILQRVGFGIRIAP